MAGRLKLSQNAIYYDVSHVFNFWREIKNSANWCVTGVCSRVRVSLTKLLIYYFYNYTF